MDYKIIRGADRIGGTITEISSGSTRLFVDFGADLSPITGRASDEKMIELIHNEPPYAVLFTHAHGDHTGLIFAIPDEVREIYIGAVALEMMKNIRTTLLEIDTLPDSEKEKLQKELDILSDKDRIRCYKDGVSVNVGGISVTPFIVDHSVYDAYMLRFESDGKCILHTGDFRNHGRLGADLIDKVKFKIADRPIDVLITEGTMMSRKNEEILTEEEQKKQAVEILTQNPYAFLICSSTNMESLASFYGAVLDSGYKRGKNPVFMVNHYVKKQLELFGKTIGNKMRHRDFYFSRSYAIEKGLTAEYGGKTQKQRMIDDGFLMLVGISPVSCDYYLGLMEQFREYNPVLIYSMWDGYLDESKEYANPVLIRMKKAWENNFVSLHTSGHASPKVIADVIKAVNPREAIVPIHTENPDGFAEMDELSEFRDKIKLCNL